MSLAETFKAMSGPKKAMVALGVGVLLAGLVILILWLAGVLFQSDDSSSGPASTAPAAPTPTAAASETVSTPTPTPTPVIV